jgi:hypothetical protein
MLTTRHAVDFAYTRQELESLFRYAHEYDVDKGGHYDARSAAINMWSHHWAHDVTREESDIRGRFYLSWEPTTLWEIEVDEGFGLEDLPRALGRLELQALGRVKHGDVAQ